MASEQEAFVSGSFGPDESVFERFAHGELASERFDGDSYRVEVDRYWRRTAARRAAAEARRADQFARADRAVSRAAEAAGAEGRPDRTAKRAVRSAARAERSAARAERTAARGGRSGAPDTAEPSAAPRPPEPSAAPRPPEPSAAPRPADPPLPRTDDGDPYREMLQSWARETAQEPVAPSRRTVTITGHGAEGYTTRNGTRASAAERYQQLPRHERSGFQPDRVAMWAVLLGVVMVLAAAATAHAAGTGHAAVVAHHLLSLR